MHLLRCSGLGEAPYMPKPFAQALLQKSSGTLLHSQTSILEGDIIIFPFSSNEFERV